MKTEKIELDVDFINGQGSLTAKEEKALNDFFKKQKLAAKKKSSIKNQKLQKGQFQ